MSSLADMSIHSSISCNRSNQNDEHGIVLHGAVGQNVVRGNVTNENALGGIVLFGYDNDSIPTGNTIKHNIALANSGADFSENLFDPWSGPYVEDGAPCRNNWKKNQFVTELGPDMCIGIPTQLDDDDVCAIDDDNGDD